jgi:hypothetical protein
LSLVVCNLVIIITRLYQVIRRTRIHVNYPVFLPRLRFAERRTRDVGHPRRGSNYRFSTSQPTSQPRIYSRKTPTRLGVDLTELSSRSGLDTSSFTESSDSSTETANERRRRHPRLGPLNTISSVDSGSPLEFAHHPLFQHSTSVVLPEPELAHLRPEFGGGWSGRSRMMSV